MAVDFAKLLSKPLDDVKKPPAWPAGTYLGHITKFEFGDQNKNNTPYARFTIHVTAAGPGLEPEEVAGIDFQKGRDFRKDFYLSEEADWRLKAFIESCGVPTAGRTFAETVPECANAQVQIEVIQQNSQRNAEELVNFAGEVVGIT
jgi:hypothetical protein